MAVTLINSVTAGSTSGTAVTTSGIDTTGASLILIWAASNNGSSAAAPTDSKSNTLTGVTAYNDGTRRGQFFYVVNPGSLGTGHTWSLTAVAPTLVVYVFSGIDSYNKETGTTGGTNSLAVGSLTPDYDGSLTVTALCGQANATSAPTVDGLFSTPFGTVGVAGTTVNGHMAYRVQGAAGAFNPNWTLVASNKALASIVFKAAASGARRRRLLTSAGSL